MDATVQQEAKDAPARAARVFLSYKRDVEPDQTLAGEIVRGLEGAGHAVFIDQRLTVGQTWAQEIEKQVHDADYLIVFLTAESSRSEMVRGEIEMARHHAATASHPRILPVRVNFDGSLPYPLNAYLDKIQYASWGGTQDTPRLLQELTAAIAGQVASKETAGPAVAASATSAPPPYAAPLPVPGGALDIDDKWYLARPTDATALALAVQPGQTLTIKGPRQMGKSSLLMRTVKAGLDHGKRVALLDFQLVDEATKADANLFFRRFAASIAEQLELKDTVEEQWDTGYSNPQNCTRYVEREILQPLGAPCMIAIDETDSIFRTAFAEDFFAMLRSWHGLRAHPVRRAWKNLDIILSTSTEPQLFIDRPHESPFNVGVVLPLEDFTPAQVATLNGLHPKPLADADVQRLYALIGGHPYLTRKALYIAASGTPTATVDDLLAHATDDAGPFGDHLRYYLLRLHGKPELIAALRQTIEHRSAPADELLVHRLQAAGLIQRAAGKVVARCELYAKYFGERLRDQG
jgi:AAA domain-containing protein/TIR domain-containing protein